jgi:hypothetical protein
LGLLYMVYCDDNKIQAIFPKLKKKNDIVPLFLFLFIGHNLYRVTYFFTIWW